jgi:hypothetical protein
MLLGPACGRRPQCGSHRARMVGLADRATTPPPVLVLCGTIAVSASGHQPSTTARALLAPRSPAFRVPKPCRPDPREPSVAAPVGVRAGPPPATAMAADRWFWVVLHRLWRWWSEVLVLVKPETVVRWHRVGFRLYGNWLSRRGRRGRPRTLPSFARSSGDWRPRTNGAAPRRPKHLVPPSSPVHTRPSTSATTDPAEPRPASSCCARSRSTTDDAPRLRADSAPIQPPRGALPPPAPRGMELWRRTGVELDLRR